MNKVAIICGDGKKTTATTATTTATTATTTATAATTTASRRSQPPAAGRRSHLTITPSSHLTMAHHCGSNTICSNNEFAKPAAHLKRQTA